MSRQDSLTSDLPPEYVPLRRAKMSADPIHKPLKRIIDSDRERKWSFPLSLLRKKHERELADRESMISGGPSMESNIGEESVPLISSPTSKRF